MKKKGFTLVEMISVIVIIGIVIIIAIPVSRNIITSNAEQKKLNKEKVVEQAARAYADIEKNKAVTCIQMTVGTLIDKGYINGEDISSTKYSSRDKTIYFYKETNEVRETRKNNSDNCEIIETYSDPIASDEQQISVEESGVIYTLVVKDDTTKTKPSGVSFSPTVTLTEVKNGTATTNTKTCNSVVGTQVGCSLEIEKGSSVKYKFINTGYANSGNEPTVGPYNESYDDEITISPITNHTYTLNVSTTSSLPFGLTFKPTIKLTTSEKTKTCSSATTCQIDVSDGGTVSYSYSQDFFNTKSGSTENITKDETESSSTTLKTTSKTFSTYNSYVKQGVCCYADRPSDTSTDYYLYNNDCFKLSLTTGRVKSVKVKVTAKRTTGSPILGIWVGSSCSGTTTGYKKSVSVSSLSTSYYTFNFTFNETSNVSDIYVKVTGSKTGDYIKNPTIVVETYQK